eukprot:TRINITY_DN14493_c0_g1_i2.p1 TRINITY_DN14493_c0_g1~~TRINITY_DN14493_c0_g1_i2.p1  ORF type:complete len:448 (+),score=57.28 TRINITY_DN14493_c0_g1_i2:68-1345(+)
MWSMISRGACVLWLQLLLQPILAKIVVRRSKKFSAIVKWDTFTSTWDHHLNRHYEADGPAPEAPPPVQRVAALEFDAKAVNIGSTPCGGVLDCPGLSFGDKFIQVGDWRLGQKDATHISIAHKNGNVAAVWRSPDGKIHGNVKHFSTWDKVIGDPSHISCGDGFVQIGDWRIGQKDATHASISHKGGKVVAIWRADGTYHSQVTHFSTWKSAGAVSRIHCGKEFIQLGDWRFGQVDAVHASMAHKGGHVAQIYRSDGTLYGNVKPFSTWGRPLVTNCVMSEWTEWDACSKQCGEGQQHRTRSPKIHAEHGGRACATDVSQTKTCTKQECSMRRTTTTTTTTTATETAKAAEAPAEETEEQEETTTAATVKAKAAEAPVEEATSVWPWLIAGLIITILVLGIGYFKFRELQASADRESSRAQKSNL